MRSWRRTSSGSSTSSGWSSSSRSRTSSLFVLGDLGGGVVGDDRDRHFGADLEGVDVVGVVEQHDVVDDVQDVVGIEFGLEHVLVEILLVEFEVACVFEVVFAHGLFGGSRGADSTPASRLRRAPNRGCAGAIPQGPTKSARLGMARTVFGAGGRIVGSVVRSRWLGVQETVGATVWPDLTVQAGYSSVLYLVS